VQEGERRRVAAREICSPRRHLEPDREGRRSNPSIIQTSKQLGMLTLNDALIELVEKKEISPDEAYVKSVEKTGLAASLKAKGTRSRSRPEDAIQGPADTQWAAITGVLLLSTMIALSSCTGPGCGSDGIAFRLPSVASTS